MNGEKCRWKWEHSKLNSIVDPASDLILDANICTTISLDADAAVR
jgi:hypothetical protein